MDNNQPIEQMVEISLEEKRFYELFVQEMIKIVKKYGKDALDVIKKAA
ncbi:MAG: hypothetical protein IKL09_06710 [Clostridia bacterium]|nr:hypothetical protein [Clostridia bacterium]